MQKIILGTMALLTLAVSAHAQGASVSDSIKIPSNAGEAQSTVVPPGKKAQCTQGRFLYSNDRLRPPSGLVTGQDLDNLGVNISSTFDMGDLAANFNTDFRLSGYWFGTNDHDLVTLSNGDVLYITGAFSSTQPASTVPGAAVPTPKWFSTTFRCNKTDSAGDCLPDEDFGPRARYVVLVFRSTDCGENFSFISEMDALRVGNGFCALPQFRRNWNLDPSPIINESPWDMGGSDGQLVFVDKKTDRIYLTYQCVGYNAIDPKAKTFALDENNKVNKTIVMMMEPSVSLKKWNHLGTIDVASWRFGIVPREGDELVFGYKNSIYTAKKKKSGKYDFGSKAVPSLEGTSSWRKEADLKANTNIPIGSIKANLWAVPVVVRVPGVKQVLLAFPDKFGDKGFGYRTFFYNQLTGQMTAGRPLLPATPSPDNVVFHLALIDPGSGPTMLYWLDLDSSTKTIMVQGQLITGKGEQLEPNFTVSMANGNPRSFNLTSVDYWFGDYYTAGGFSSKDPKAVNTGPAKAEIANNEIFSYYPMWVEPDGSVNYARVQFAVSTNLLSSGGTASKVLTMKFKRIPETEWVPQPFPVEFSQIIRSNPLELEEREFTEQQRLGISQPPVP